MHSQIQEWMHHPVTKALFKRLLELEEIALQETLGSNKESAFEKVIRLKVIKEIIDVETLLAGELPNERRNEGGGA